MKTFTTRNEARAIRKAVNEKVKASGSKATLRDPVKNDDGRWSFPGISHGKKLTLKK